MNQLFKIFIGVFLPLIVIYVEEIGILEFWKSRKKISLFQHSIIPLVQTCVMQLTLVIAQLWGDNGASGYLPAMPEAGGQQAGQAPAW